MSDDIRTLSRQMKAIAKDAPRRITEAINRALPRLEAALEEEAPVASGALVASIHIIAARIRRNPRGQVRADAHHAAAVDLGAQHTHRNDFVDRACDREAPRLIDRVTNEFLSVM